MSAKSICLPVCMYACISVGVLIYVYMYVYKLRICMRAHVCVCVCVHSMIYVPKQRIINSLPCLSPMIELMKKMERTKTHFWILHRQTELFRHVKLSWSRVWDFLSLLRDGIKMLNLTTKVKKQKQIKSRLLRIEQSQWTFECPHQEFPLRVWNVAYK